MLCVKDYNLMKRCIIPNLSSDEREYIIMLLINKLFLSKAYNLYQPTEETCLPAIITSISASLQSSFINRFTSPTIES